MGTIPAPNIVQDAEQISQNPLTEYSRAVQLQTQQQQLQQQRIQTQVQQQQLADQQAMTKAMQQWDGQDITQLPDLMRKNGISGPGYLNAQQAILARQQQLTTLSKDQLANQQAHHDAALGVINSAEQVPDEQLSQHMADSVQQLQAQGHLSPQEAQAVTQHAQSMPPDQFRPWLDVYKKGLQAESQQIAQAKSQAETQEATGKGAQASAEAALTQLKTKGLLASPGDVHNMVSAVTQGSSDPTLGPRTEALMNAARGMGNFDAMQKALVDASQEIGGVQKDIAVNTNPQIQQGKVAVAQAEGAARANIEAQMARGSDAALSTVPPHLIGPATAAASKAGQDYAQSQSVSQRLQAMMDDARKGNVVSYQLIPQEGALQVTTSQGVHRINMAEIQNYGGGSLWQRLEGHIGKALTGESIPSSVLDDMAEMQKIQAQGSQTKYENDLKTINQTYGSKFQPVTMANLPQNGKAAPAPPSTSQPKTKASKWGAPI